MGQSEPLLLEIGAAEWKCLAKKIVKAEVYGTSDTCRTSFMSVLTMLEERQDLWHKADPVDDCPYPYRERQEMNHGCDSPMCLMLARQAKRVVHLFDFS
jgi:hypothetical protein